MTGADGSIAAILLAAGRGTRFGGGKLEATLAGKPLAHHAADALRAAGCPINISVQAAGSAPLPGFASVPLAPPGAPLSASIRAGVAAAEAAGASAVLIALADMPLVPPRHFAALLQAFDQDRIATRAGGQRMPPAVFGARHFAALRTLDGNRGAGALLRDAPFVALDPALAIDIDTPADLAAAGATLAHSPGR